MSAIVDAAVKALNAKLAGGGFDGSVKFVIEDEGEVVIDGDGARAADGEADCVLTADADTFQGMLDGDVEPDLGLHERPAQGRRRHGPRDEARRPAGMTEPAPFHADVADAPGRRPGVLARRPRTACACAPRSGTAATRGTAIVLPGPHRVHREVRPRRRAG